ncbi:MAG: T9SS type A sorting domain-containing protein [Chitinophagaceae bacterium]|nr:T9SS type A sorting domain-containing protein [Chitinophagaceae bacterium]
MKLRPKSLLHISMHFRCSMVLFSLLLSYSSKSQINAYARVTSISGVNLSLSDINQTYHTFTVGEEIIVMQMQDDVIGSNTTNTSSYGSISDISSAGLFDIVTISAFSGTSLTINTELSNSYHFSASSNVQIITFRKYGEPDYTTTAAVTALPWNGRIGGVIAMKVPGVLTLAHSIIADGQGFRGGAVSSNHEMSCQPSIYASNSTIFAARGEGIQVNATGFARGRAPLANGGGGGSDTNGGGAGGSNYSDGGMGGHGWNCSSNPTGGLGGYSLRSYISRSRVFLGGGGGGGQQNNTVGTVGGIGGGIILIKANSITTTGSAPLKISSNGLTAGNSGNDGAGGGGAGGSIVISAGSFSIPSASPLSMEGVGGNGGNVNNAGAHGGGGGGGQGVVIYSSAQPIANAITRVNNGTGGNNSSATGSTTAGTGTTINNSGIISNAGGSTLPVKLTNFTVKYKETFVQVMWTTMTEQNNDYFNVQRSINGVQFSTVGKMKGAGNSSTPLSYSFTDRFPVSGKMMYRLQQIDFDGTILYSAIVVVENKEKETGMDVYPNPVNDQFTVEAALLSNSNCRISVIDLSGKTVWTTNAKAAGGQVRINLSTQVKPGVHVVRITYADGVLFSKILVQ